MACRVPIPVPAAAPVAGYVTEAGPGAVINNPQAPRVVGDARTTLTRDSRAAEPLHARAP
jgi:hypothetical protein